MRVDSADGSLDGVRHVVQLRKRGKAEVEHAENSRRSLDPTDLTAAAEMARAATGSGVRRGGTLLAYFMAYDGAVLGVTLLWLVRRFGPQTLA